MKRIITAVLQNIDDWRDRILEIESQALPSNKVRLLALARDIEMAKRSLMRLTGRLAE